MSRPSSAAMESGVTRGACLLTSRIIDVAEEVSTQMQAHKEVVQRVESLSSSSEMSELVAAQQHRADLCASFVRKQQGTDILRRKVATLREGIAGRRERLAERARQLEDRRERYSRCSRGYQSIRSRMSQALQQHSVEKAALRMQQRMVYGRRITLLHELNEIFPIRRSEGAGYSKIRAICLPKTDVLKNRDPREAEDFAIGLGLVAHALQMLSKYLSVPLRWRVLCVASRSGLEDRSGPGAVEHWPLYHLRQADGRRFDGGVDHLAQAVLQLAHTVAGKPTSPPRNNAGSIDLLEGLHRVFFTYLHH
eukprot:CAMPEP_0204336982 /NCGR_PEP_ID=MMETSP0469-20131031/19951_1 /ASSEMBLY_ACC=CAM_ASM_000384 /TAXON_ID=2969 /ORGANISM="Oxyrrhis marina" /LENGTH=307 /DNA_ID=CAMNT_0051320939 /DNA_START=19 /DNA_END=939 /DNA_ORIENTATION=-